MPKGTRITKPKPQIAPSPELSVHDWERLVVEHAEYFTLCFKQGIGRAARKEFNFLRSAIAARADNPRGMIYAITKEGRSVLIAPSQYVEMLQLRKEI